MKVEVRRIVLECKIDRSTIAYYIDLLNESIPPR